MKRVVLALGIACTASPLFAWGRGGVPEWVKQLAQVKLPAYAEDVNGVALLSETITTVNDSGEMRTVHRHAYRVLTTAGRELGYIAIHFDNQTRISGLHAWGYTASGEEYQIGDRDAMESSAFDGELYADNKMKVLKIPAAEPGNVIAWEYEQRERPYSLQTSWDFQDSEPVRTARFALYLPAGWSHEEKWSNSAATASKPTPLNGVAWELTDVPGIKHEVGMPATRAVAGRMTVNFLPPAEQQRALVQRSWADVGKWYAALANPRRGATPALQAKVKELTASKAAPLDKVRALAEFAQRDVRYVAIEIGIGDYQPHMAADVFSNRYGDCKDKVTVMSAMLREIGVDSYYVLAQTRRGVVDKETPYFGSFNHAIIAIKVPAGAAAKGLYATVDHPRLGKLLLFDPTSPWTPLGLIPLNLQENRGLLVTDEGGEIIDFPAMPADASQLTVAAKLKLSAEGALAGEVTETRSGTIAASFRDALQSMNEGEKKQWFEKRMARYLSQATLTDIAVENGDDVAKDLVIRYKLQAESYARRAAGLLLVRPRVIGRKAETVVDLKERKYAYETDGPSLETDDVEIALPAGLVADELPPALNLTSPAVSYTSESKFENGALHYRRQYKVQKFVVPVEGIAELNKVYTQILGDERNSAVLKAR